MTFENQLILKQNLFNTLDPDLYKDIQNSFPEGKNYEAFTTREYFPTLKHIVLKQYLSDKILELKNTITAEEKEHLEFFSKAFIQIDVIENEKPEIRGKCQFLFGYFYVVRIMQYNADFNK